MSQAAVFLDRDGVINENRDDYVKNWEEIRFLPGALDAMAILASTPFRIVLVTNQSIIGRGMLTQAQVEKINRRLAIEVEAHGGRLDGIYFCPHHPNEGCLCRKPRPGLIMQAACDLDIDLTRSFLVGDAVSDIDAALAAGCYPILVLTGRGQQQLALLRQREYNHVHVVDDLTEAVRIISVSIGSCAL